MNGGRASGLERIWGPAAEKLLIVALTGGIASGKSEVACELSRLGATVIDADQIARDVVLPGTDAFKDLVDAFGEQILDDSGLIDRAALSRVVFTDEKKRKVLNGITHPRIMSEIIGRVGHLADHLGPDEVPAAVVDAALIIDIGASGVFDRIIVVSADAETRVRRLVLDRSMSAEDAEDRIASQVPDSQRLESADFVIKNDGTLDQLKERVREVWSEVGELANQPYS